jgi:DNA invertase Pin-like site-specific DNA recombinase
MEHETNAQGTFVPGAKNKSIFIRASSVVIFGTVMREVKGETNMKRFLAWVCTRTSGSRAAEAQEAALHRYAMRHQGLIVRQWRTSNAPHSFDYLLAREQFLAYAKEHADTLDGILFYSLDRAAHNISELRTLVRLEVEHGLKLIFVGEPYENKPAARLERRFVTGLLGVFQVRKPENPQEKPTESKE